MPKRIVLQQESIPLKGVPTLIENSLRKIQRELQQNQGKLTLEFFLPTELLSYHIEEEIPGSDYPIGVDYRVVVRPLERLKQYDRLNRLRRYWGESDKLKDTVGNCAKWLEIASHCLVPVLDRGLIFLGLNFVPDKQFFKELVCSGTPMALWIRSEKVKQWQRDLYYQEFCRCRLEELPERLRLTRSVSWGEYQHTGHLSLLWDDPNRIPLELQEDFELRHLQP